MQFKFSSILREKYKQISYNEKEKAGYIKYGKDNKFPYYLVDLFNSSALHSACIAAITDAVIGNGLTTEDEEILQTANTENESWNDILKKVALDYKLFGGFALEVIWSADRTRIAEVYHLDFSTLRAKKHEGGVCPGYYISYDWSDFYAYNANMMDLEDVPYLPIYNPEKKGQEPKQIYVYKPYHPNQRYYPLPDYMGATKVVDMDTEIDNFHINNLQNGLTPSLAITTFTNADEDERHAIEAMLKEQYQGTDNAGAMLYMDVDAPENAPQITPIPQNGADGYYTAINELTEQKILSAHRITSPMILGIKTSGQLGGRDELLDAYLLMLNTVIKPYQANILRCFEELLEYNYGEITLGIEQLKLFDDGTEEVDVVTSDESEAGEDKELEEKVDNADANNDILNTGDET